MANNSQNNTKSTLIHNQIKCLQNICSFVKDHNANNEKNETIQTNKNFNQKQKQHYIEASASYQHIIPELNIKIEIGQNLQTNP